MKHFKAYKSEKRKKEVLRQKKQEEKRRKRLQGDESRIDITDLAISTGPDETQLKKEGDE